MLDRIETVCQTDKDIEKILYLMTKSFRIHNNYSLNEAIRLKEVNSASLTVIILEPIEENPRNKRFFLDNTSDLPDRLLSYAKEVKRLDSQSRVIDSLEAFDTIVIDKAYLNRDRDLLEKIIFIAKAVNKRVIEVDSNVFQPTRLVSSKLEYSARTIRDKIWRLFLQPLVLQDEIPSYGEEKAWDVLLEFLDKRLINYGRRNEPSENNLSGLSPYLKYGFISPNQIYHEVVSRNMTNSDSFLEELIVRRELAYNYVLYNRNHDKFSGITDEWAYRTMALHENDYRQYVYTINDYVTFNTHDRYFNAAMKEMVYLGRMHSYMRMYWAKKIIEWSASYEDAYNIAIYLNNRYFIDGNTPNGYAGVAWCFGKHDRAWTERPIFGKLRYMNDKGLERKFDIEGYVNRIEEEIKEL